jgi:hypothetical protein
MDDPSINLKQVFINNKMPCDDLMFRPSLEDAVNYLCACKVKGKLVIYHINVETNEVNKTTELPQVVPPIK